MVSAEELRSTVTTLSTADGHYGETVARLEAELLQLEARKQEYERGLEAGLMRSQQVILRSAVAWSGRDR
jgi:hypothetical protein